MADHLRRRADTPRKPAVRGPAAESGQEPMDLRGRSAALVARLQRAAGNDAVQRLLARPAVSRAEETAAGTAPADGPVVDDAAEPAAGQMRRTPFLAALRTELEGALAGADPLAQADSRAHLPAAFADLAAQDTAGITRSLRENLPGVRGLDAREWISAAGVAARARAGGEAVVPAGGVVGRVLSAVGGLVSALFKARDGVATPDDARVVRGRLGTGQTLDAGVRAPMERAYGQDFSGVRVHTDAAAGALSDRMGARAFTVGSDIAFSPGEYQPDSVVGSALIAHELAHVGQQAGGGGSSVAGLEEDADRAAVGAVVSRWAGVEGTAIEGAMPRLRAGLRLQRCAGSQVRPAAPQSCAALTPDQWRTAVTDASGRSGAERAAAMTALVQQAVCELGIAVRQAGTSHPADVHPDDYAETPVLNFDAGLNDKRRWPRKPGAKAASIGTNVGYNFHAGERKFAILGPSALNPDTWLTTRQYAQHELSLVAMDQPAGRTEEDVDLQKRAQELQQWTQDFRGYFHQYLGMPLSSQPAWDPLIQYYEQTAAAPEVRQQSLNQLADYYDNPPGPDPDRVRRAMHRWLRRRSGSGQLVTDLTRRLPPAPAR